MPYLCQLQKLKRVYVHGKTQPEDRVTNNNVCYVICHGTSGISQVIDILMHLLFLLILLCDIYHVNPYLESKALGIMSSGRLVAIAVDPSDYSEKAFDCESVHAVDYF